MKRNNLRIASIGALAAVGFSLAGCGQAASTDADSAGAQSLEVWTRSDGEGAKTYDAVFEKFTEETGIEVKHVADPDLSTRLQASASAGDLPDMIINDAASLGTYQSQGLLEALDPATIDVDGVVSQDTWDTTIGLDGEHYGVPWSRHVLSADIRSDWLDSLGLAAPVTLDDFAEVAEAFATQDPDGNGQDDTEGWAVPLTADNGYATWWIAPIVWGFGGDFVADNEDGTFTSMVASDETIAAVDAARSVGCHDPALVQADAITADSTGAYDTFLAGQAGINTFGPWQTLTIDEKLGAENWEILAPPAGPEGTVGLAEGENIYLMAGSDAQDARGEFAQWALGEEAQTLAMTFNTTPAVKLPVNTNIDAGEVRDDPRWSQVQDIYVESGRFFPWKIDFGAIRQATGESLNAVFADCSTNQTEAEMADLDKVIVGILESQGVGS